MVLAAGIASLFGPKTHYERAQDGSQEFYIEDDIELLPEPKEEVLDTPTILTYITDFSEQYSVDEYLVRKIIQCESGFVKDAVHINKIDGIEWSRDYGLGQINDYYHKDTMELLGLDIHNPKDNLEFTFILLKNHGTQPYQASKNCWQQVSNEGRSLSLL